MPIAEILNLNRDLINRNISDLTESINEGNYEKIILFGAGFLGRSALEGLRELGIEPLCFIDEYLSVQGFKIEGLDVLSAEEAFNKFGESSIVVVTIWHPKVEYTIKRDLLLELGFGSVIHYCYLVWKFPETLRKFSMFDTPLNLIDEVDKIKEAYLLLSDKASRISFEAILRWLLFGDFENQRNLVNEEYFFLPNMMNMLKGDIIIDCGAYDGDTLMKFIDAYSGQFGKIFCVEPDPSNFSKLRTKVEAMKSELKSKIGLLNCALGSTKKRLLFDNTGLMSSALSTKGNIEVDCKTLDDICQGISPSYIKFDIEGAEIDALVGGEETLKSKRPILAVSTYHKQNHLWEIPLLINRFVDDYHFYLRINGMDFVDSILYAAPKERLLNSN